jgi:hypothetical protein
MQRLHRMSVPGGTLRAPALGPLRFRLAALLSIGWLAACETAPVDQIHQFSQAFNAVNTAGQPLLDDLSIAERTLGQRNAPNRPVPPKDDCHYTQLRSTEEVLGLCARDAPVFSDVGDPPNTRLFRKGLTTLQRYIDILVGLADGKATADTVAQANALLQNLGGVATLTGGPAASAGLQGAIDALTPLLSDIVNQLSAREARQLILKSEKPVRALIIALRDSTPSVFNTVTTDTETRLGIRHSPTLAADKAKYEAYRKIVANYYVLLDQLNDTWTETVAAAQTPSPTTITDIANRAGQLKADAAAVNRAYSILRTGVVPTAP